jgi:hypothetical protein
MNLQRLSFHLSVVALMSLVGCASTMSISANTETAKSISGQTQPPPQVPIEITQETTKKPQQVVDNGFLICKASRNRFHYDWSAGSAAAGQGLIDQNNVRYEFRSAAKPAGSRGENLKVGECGWESEALANRTPAKSRRSQVVFKSLSDETTQTFYKIKTGKVFKVPVRQTKNGLVAAPGGVSVLR